MFLIPLLLNLPLQNSIFPCKNRPAWPNSPQTTLRARFELRRSLAAGQQKHFSLLLFELLRNLEGSGGFVLTPSFPGGNDSGRLAVCMALSVSEQRVPVLS